MEKSLKTNEFISLTPFILTPFILCFFILLLTSCLRPRVKNIAPFFDSIPIGISREDVWELLIERFNYYDKSNYFQSHLIQLTSYKIDSIKRNKEFSKNGFYKEKPDGLLNSLHNDLFGEGVALLRERKYGEGSIILFYDKKTNYIGYIAYSHYK